MVGRRAAQGRSADPAAGQLDVLELLAMVRIAVVLMLFAWPLLEILLLVEVGGRIGFWWTLLLVVVTAILGMIVIVRQGFSAAQRMQQALMRGETPLLPMIDGAMIVTAGVLLVTPGLMADALGLLLLVPPARWLLADSIGRALFGVAAPTAEERPGSLQGQEPRTGAGRSAGSGPVIDGDFTRVDERPDELPPDRTDRPRRP